MRDVIATALANAHDIDDEVVALTASLDERARNFVLARWGFSESPLPTLEELGAREGVTRERVRQVVTLHETRLQEIQPQLLLSRQAVDALTMRGGMLTDRQFLDALHEADINTSGSGRWRLPQLGSLGLIPPICFDAATQLWLDGSRIEDFITSGLLVEARRVLLKGGRNSILRIGAVRSHRLSKALPLPEQVAMRLLVGDCDTVAVSGFVVPIPQQDSRLSRAVRKMLAVTPALALDDIRRGLHHTGHKSIRVPVTVLKTVLINHDAFRFVDGKVRLRQPLHPHDVLGPYDLELVRAMETRGGMMTAAEIQCFVTAQGHSAGWMLRLGQLPFLEHMGRSVYALRGRRLAPDIERLRDRPDGRNYAERTLASAEWTDDDATCHLRYRTRFSDLLGALKLPEQLSARIQAMDPEAWQVRVEHGVQPVQQIALAGNGQFLWDLKPWLGSVHPTRDQHLAVEFSFERRTITLSLLDAVRARADEETWVRERVERLQDRVEDVQDRTVRRAATMAARFERKAAQLEKLAARSEPTEASRLELLARRLRERAASPAALVTRRSKTKINREFGVYFEVPIATVDLSAVQYYRLRDVPVTGSVLAIAVFRDFHLAPETKGVVMAVVCQIGTGGVQRRRFHCQLIEEYRLDQAEELTPQEALELLPGFDRAVARNRVSISWREFGAPPALPIGAGDEEEEEATESSGSSSGRPVKANAGD